MDSDTIFVYGEHRPKLAMRPTADTQPDSVSFFKTMRALVECESIVILGILVKVPVQDRIILSGLILFLQ